MANLRTGTVHASKDIKLSTKLGAYVESFSLTMDRKKANSIQDARREAKEGKTVPLRSL